MALGYAPMSRESGCITVLGIDVAFRPGADMGRARRAAEFVEKRFEALKSPGVLGKDIMLTFLALGLADDLLQMMTRQEETQARLTSLLDKIETSL